MVLVAFRFSLAKKRWCEKWLLSFQVYGPRDLPGNSKAIFRKKRDECIFLLGGSFRAPQGLRVLVLQPVQNRRLAHTARTELHAQQRLREKRWVSNLRVDPKNVTHDGSDVFGFLLFVFCVCASGGGRVRKGAGF